MGNLAQPKSDKISILDPGCGTAILSCSLIEKLIEKYFIKEINLSLFETDKIIIEETEKVISFLKNWLLEKRIKLNVKIEFQKLKIITMHPKNIHRFFERQVIIVFFTSGHNESKQDTGLNNRLKTIKNFCH